MNFNFLNSQQDLSVFKRYCLEAEDFARSYPDVSITAARKAEEYMVKLLYGSAVSTMIDGMTAFRMLSDPRFIAWIDNAALLDCFHFIRKMGNLAVHQGGLSADDAMNTLEHLYSLAGGVCMRLGLIKSYPPFDPQLQSEAPEDEPTVDQALIARFAGRLHKVFAPSQQRVQPEIRDGFLSTKDMSAMKKFDPAAKMEDTATNSRAAFQRLAEYITMAVGEENVLADYHDLCLHVSTGRRTVVAAVRTASARIAVKSPQGEWLYLPGIDYVLYTDKLDAAVPVPDQFRVFTAQEFVKLWQDINHIHPVVTAGTARRLKRLLGPDVKITVEEYADELRIQNLNTAHRKKKAAVAEALAALPAVADGGINKILE